MRKYKCDYGCGQEAKYQFKNGKRCCEDHYMKCPTQRKKTSTRIKEMWEEPNSKLNLYREKLSNRMKESWKDPNNIFNSILYRKKRSDIMKKLRKETDNNYTILYKEKLSKLFKFNIKKINKKYPFFSKIEKMRYNPINSKEIQVHCINHECENSKEKGGWFTPTRQQLTNRIQAIENPKGFGESNFYCCQECKDSCLLYGLHHDPYINNGKPYTQAEKGLFNNLVLERDNEICYYCGGLANTVHHLRPQKLEPFFALDPDYAISVCINCHYKYGHPTGSDHSTGNLAKIVCSVESQKFLEQNHK